MQLKYRILGGLGAVLLSGTAVVTSAAIGGADSTGGVSDVVTFSARTFLAIPPTEAKPGFATLVSRDCRLKSDHERTAVPCTIVGTASLTLSGGTFKGTIKSSDGIITVDEAFVATSATRGTGTGTATEFDFDDHATSTATFTESFSTAPTAVANISNTKGTVIFTDDKPDTEPVPTTTTVPVTTTAGG